MMRDPGLVGLVRAASLAGLVGVTVLGGVGCASSGPRAPEPGDLAAAVKLAERADEETAEGAFAEAEQYYLASLRADALQHNVWNNLGVVYMNQDNLFDASRAFRRAIEIEPREARPHVNLGVLWLRVDPREAVPHFERALSVDPGSVEAMRGIVQARKRSNTEASAQTIELITRALLYEQDPEWRTFFVKERDRIESELDARNSWFTAEGV